MFLRKSHRGFTLVEGMIVLAIMGIALAMALPSFRTWILNTHVRNGAEILMSGLQNAKMESLRKNARVSLWLVQLADLKTMEDTCTKSATGVSWVVSIDDPEGACATPQSDTVAPRIAATYAAGDGSRNVVVGAEDAAGNAAYCATFNGMGQVLDACADGTPSIRRITVDSLEAPGETRSYELRLTAGGIVRMCDPTVTSAGDPRRC